MTLKLNSSGGFTSIDAHASAANNALVLPQNNGSANQVLKTDGSGNLSWVAQAAGGKILQVVNKVWTTEDTLSNSFTANKYDQSVTTEGANSNWIFIAQPARMLVKANSEIKARVNESTNDIGDTRREWRNYTSSDNRAGCTAFWYYDWSLAAGATVTMSLQWYSNSNSSSVGDGGQNSNFIIIEVAA